jgi:DNA-binding NtrC family response regulator
MYDLFPSPGDPPTSDLEKILVVEDDRLVRLTVCEQLSQAGLIPIAADTLGEARALAEQVEPSAYVIDIRLPDGSGIDLLRSVRAQDADVPVLVITGHGSASTAVEVTQLGATEYLAKPFDPEELVLLVRRALATAGTRRELRLRRERAASGYGELQGQSPAMKKLFALLSQLEAADAPTVLIEGESGTGKELVARAVHSRSRRNKEPFLEIDCTGLDERLVQSQLFGHERGAFTDAKERKAGLFEVAGRGTIFLDEIGELGLQTQSQLLRALESRRFRRVGGTTALPLRARFVAATNRDLSAEVAEGRFRQDLYYRLAVIQVQVPPLRAREGDIPLLCRELLRTLAHRSGRKAPRISAEAMEMLEACPWPGNVRQLRNVLERAMILQGDPITPDALPLDVRQPSRMEAGRRDGGFVLPPEGVDLNDVQASLIEQALERTRGNRTAAGRLLGLTRFTVRYQAEKLGLLDVGAEPSDDDAGPDLDP